MRQSETAQNPGRRARLLQRTVVAIGLLLLALRLYFGPPIARGQREPRPRPPGAFFRCPCPQIFAHRGASAYRPENTLPAFRLAGALGADVLEFDVRLSADGRVVVFHDDDLERVTGVKGPVSGRTYAQLRLLDAAANFVDARGRRSFAGKGIHMPLLSEVLRAFPRGRFNIELKDKGPALAHRVNEELSALGAHERALVTSVHDSAMDVWMRLDRNTPGDPTPPGPVGAATRRVLTFYLAYTLGFHPERTVNALQLPERRILWLGLTHKSFIDFAHRQGTSVHYWTVNDPGRMRVLVERGADGIMTDRPDLAFDLFHSLGLRRGKRASRKN